MSENRPKQSNRKLSLIAPFTIGVLVLLILLAAIHLSDSGGDAIKIEPVVVTPAVRLPSIAIPKAEPVLLRADLVRAMWDAADDFSAQIPLKGKDPLIGRKFRVRIAFGCKPPQLELGNGQTMTVYLPESRTLRLVAKPVVWTTLPIGQSLADDSTIESVEGFWIPRAWTSDERCPRVATTPTSASATVLPQETLGLAQIFHKDASRLTQHGDRPYEFVRQLSEQDLSLLSHTYWLVLEGRITGFKSGKAVHCWSESAEHRPVCLFAVSYERVALEDGDTNQILAEWND